MNTNLIAKQSIFIDVSPANVWHALVTPELIKRYLFGTEAVSDWKVGSIIKYKGVWNGKPYEDKGTILSLVPEKLLETTYWSSMSGLDDSPKNYKKVTYKLTSKNNGTWLTITQDANASEEEKDRSEGNWKVVMNSLKELLEAGT
jgi:uncharacterized protein YndB with AHSA1/START domain